MSKDLEHFDAAAFLLAYDTGSISKEQITSGFQHLIDTGEVWRLEGRYGKAAQALIDAGECAATSANLPQSERPGDVGPYVNVSKDATRQVDGSGYRLVLYGAYNALGLVGSECNGIAIFSESEKRIVTDEVGIENTGYFGPSQAQLRMFDRLMTCPDAEFRTIVNESPNARYQMEEPGSPKLRTPRL